MSRIHRFANGRREQRSDQQEGLRPNTDVSRRDFLRTTALGAAGFAWRPGDLLGRKAAAQPNVLLVMVDQMRLPQRVPAGVELPSYERLCREGLLFNNFFTSAVPCSASRATMFTGLHQPQHGVATNVAVGPIPGDGSMCPDIPTLGHAFQAAGYRTPYFGKWHLSEADDYKETGLSAYGFEEWEGPDSWGLPYQGTIQDRKIAGDAVQWLRRNGQDGPWFMTCSLVNPHDVMYYRRLDAPPIVVPDLGAPLPPNFDDTLEGKPEIQKQYQEVYGMYTGTPPDASEKVWREYLDYYYFLTKKADDQMARVLDELDRQRLTDDTIVLFISDHGEMAGAHRLQSKGPFVYQENNLVPMVVRWPGHVPAGTETAALSQTVDLFPTLVELAGIKADTSYMPGHSLAPIALDQRDTDINTHVLMVFPYSNQDEFTQAAGKGPIPPITAPMQIRAICNGQYKFARYFDRGVDYEEYELYDLAEDPYELWNVADDGRYVAVRNAMEIWLREAEATEMAIVNPDWVKKA